jgi:hypothetical protein
MKTYNDITIPPIIRTDRIISAFENEIDWNKVDDYTNIMQEKGLSHDFPPIYGYPHLIDEDDIGKMFLEGSSVEEEHLGHLVWMVTDGHHRSLAAIAAEIPHLEVELDYSCITSEQDLNSYNNH